MSPRPGIDVEISGPLFKKGAKITRDAMEDAVQELVELGEDRLDRGLRPGPAGLFLSAAKARPGRASQGHYRRNVQGESEGLKGRIDDGGVIYGPWLEGTSSRNQSTRFKGYGAFRLVGQWLEKKSDEVMEKHARKAVQRMKGR
jgi:hypothetical protein